MKIRVIRGLCLNAFALYCPCSPKRTYKRGEGLACFAVRRQSGTFSTLPPQSPARFAAFKVSFTIRNILQIPSKIFYFFSKVKTYTADIISVGRVKSQIIDGAHIDVQAHRFFYLLPVVFQKIPYPVYRLDEGFLIRQENNTEMIRFMPVKARTVNQ